MKHSMVVFAAGIFLTLAVRSPAGIMDPADMDPSFAFGVGANTAYIVIDFNPGDTLHAGDSLAWSWSWDGSGGSVYDALFAIDSADSRVIYNVTDFGGSLGKFLDGVAYDSDGTPTADNNPPNELYRDRQGGWANTFGFWLGPITDDAWTSAGAGISGTPLQDGWAYGFSWNFTDGYPGPAPNAVPEPATATLFAVAGLTLAGFRRRAAIIPQR